jgi:hypothetical protein
LGGEGGAVGEVAVEDEVGEGVGAEFVEGACASGVAGGSGVGVQDVVDALGFGGAEVGVEVAGVLAGVGAVGDAAAAQAFLGGGVGVVGVEAVHGPVCAGAEVIGVLGAGELEEVAFEVAADAGGDLFCFFGGQSGEEGEGVLVFAQRVAEGGDDGGFDEVDAAFGQGQQGVGESGGEGEGGLHHLAGAVLAPVQRGAKLGDGVVFAGQGADSPAFLPRRRGLFGGGLFGEVLGGVRGLVGAHGVAVVQVGDPDQLGGVDLADEPCVFDELLDQGELFRTRTRLAVGVGGDATGGSAAVAAVGGESVAPAMAGAHALGVVARDSRISLKLIGRHRLARDGLGRIPHLSRRLLRHERKASTAKIGPQPPQSLSVDNRKPLRCNRLRTQ